MNLWGPEFATDDELTAAIKQYRTAYLTVRSGSPAEIVRKISGEGRLLEFAPVADSMTALLAELREMLAEARRRGLAVGGNGGGAIAVEIGYP